MPEALIIGFSGLGVLILLIALRMPIAYAMILVGGVGVTILNGPAISAGCEFPKHFADRNQSCACLVWLKKDDLAMGGRVLRPLFLQRSMDLDSVQCKVSIILPVG